MALMKAPPNRNATRAGHQLGTPNDSSISIEDARSDQKLAAIMTPDANPSMVSMTRRSIVLNGKTNAAPTAVKNQVPQVATTACATRLSSANQVTTLRNHGDADTEDRLLGLAQLTHGRRPEVSARLHA